MTMTLANSMLLTLAGRRELQHLKIFSFGNANQLTCCDRSLIGKLFNPAPGPMDRHRVNPCAVTKSEIKTRTLLRGEPGTCRNKSREFPATRFHRHRGSDRVAIAFGPA